MRGAFPGNWGIAPLRLGPASESSTLDLTVKSLLCRNCSPLLTPSNCAMLRAMKKERERYCQDAYSLTFSHKQILNCRMGLCTLCLCWNRADIAGPFRFMWKRPGNVRLRVFPGFFASKPPLRRLLQGQGGIFMSKTLLSAHHIVQYFGEQKILEFEKLTVYGGTASGSWGPTARAKPRF